jgi:hypothetical protein
MKRESTQKEKKPSSKESVFLRAPKNEHENTRVKKVKEK